MMGHPKQQNRGSVKIGKLHGEAVHVPDRPPQCNKNQVPTGRLHVGPIQWNLKVNWHAPESLEEPIPIPKSLYKHLPWWLQEENILVGQPLHSPPCLAKLYN